MQRTLGGVILAATLLLTACGSDDPGSTDTVAAVETAPPDERPADTAPADTAPADTAAAPSEDTSAPMASSAGPIDACAVLGSLDLEALLAEPTGELIDNSSDFGAFCRTPAANTESSGGVSLTISMTAAASNFERQKEQAGVDSEVTGLGDAAFHSGPMILVLAGDTLITVSAVQDRDLGAGGVTDAALETAAAQVLSALG